MSKKNLIDTSSMSGSELVTLYNNLASEAALLGMPQYKPVVRFATSEVGRKRIEGVQVAIESAGSEGKEVTITEIQNKINGTETIVPEELRQDTLAKQEAARKAVRETKPEESDMAAAAKKSARKAAPKTKTDKAPAKARGFADDAVITVKAKENPRRGAAAERFDLYKDGMTVAQYSKKFEGGRSEALVHLRWDVKHGHITVK